MRLHTVRCIYVTVSGTGRSTTSVYGSKWHNSVWRGEWGLFMKVYLHSTLQEIVCNKEEGVGVNGNFEYRKPPLRTQASQSHLSNQIYWIQISAPSLMDMWPSANYLTFTFWACKNRVNNRIYFVDNVEGLMMMQVNYPPVSGSQQVSVTYLLLWRETNWNLKQF